MSADRPDALPRAESPDLAGFVHARGLALVPFAVAVCGHRELAEDLVQEALAKLVRRFGEQLSVERPEAYVKRAIVREFLQWRRRQPRPLSDLECERGTVGFRGAVLPG